MDSVIWTGWLLRGLRRTVAVGGWALGIGGFDVFLVPQHGTLEEWTSVGHGRRAGGRELPQGYSSKTFPVSVDWPRRVGFVEETERRRIRFCLYWIRTIKHIRSPRFTCWCRCCRRHRGPPCAGNLGWTVFGVWMLDDGGDSVAKL